MNGFSANLLPFQLHMIQAKQEENLLQQSLVGPKTSSAFIILKIAKKKTKYPINSKQKKYNK